MTEQLLTSDGIRNGDASFPAQYGALTRLCKARAIPITGMQNAGAIELNLGGSFESASTQLAGEINITRLEGAITRRSVPPARNGSRLRYFLDGTQYTYAAFRVLHVPVFAAVTAAAILTRDAAGNATVVAGTLRMQHAWIIPAAAPFEQIQGVCDVLREIGGRIVDPLASLAHDEALYARAASDYGHVERKALQAARKEREALERDLLLDWSRDRPDNGWIVVDGALRASIPRAVGLVKSFTYQYLTGEEASELFALPDGYRTGAFIAANRWRQAGEEDDPARTADERTLWYLRFHDPAGHDARHALVRIEAASDLRDSATIDELSAWLLAERAPRATADARWDSLIYPIHLLERMLKRRVSADTLAWPGARQRG